MNRIKQLTLLIADLGLLFGSLYLTLLIRYKQIPETNIWQGHLEPFSIVFLLWILILYINNLYTLHSAVNNTKFLQKTFKSTTLAGIISVLFFYLFPQIIAPKTNLLIFILIFSIIFIIWRRLFNWLIKSYIPKTNIAIIGVDDEVKQLVKDIKENPHMGYKIAFVIGDEEECDGVLSYSGIDKIKNLIQEHKITKIILAENPHHSDRLRAILFDCIKEKISYENLPNFYEKITGKIPVRSLTQTWFLENLNEGSKQFFSLAKKISDIFFATFIFVVTIPFWPIIALIIKLESKGPIFYKQIRIGQYEKKFNIIKFRTMKDNAEKDGAQWAQKNDTRITTFGNFMRIARIDEIPQVINILKGEMSFIGPRPERPEFTEKLKEKIPFYNERHLVKPGLSGWAQINYDYGASEEDSLRKLQYDLFYIKNRSIYLDISIVLKTIATVLSRAGR